MSARGQARVAARVRARYGPWAVVTGASDGIGRELATCIAACGLDLVLVARRDSVLRAVAQELERDHGVTVRVLAADLAAPDGVAAVVEVTRELDVGLLVAAAGFGSSGAFLTLPLADELAMVDVNCRAVIALTHAFGQRFAARGRGGMVLMSSLLAFQGVPRAATYAATKAFVQTFAEGVQRELAPAGVDVVACAPGPIYSQFAERAGMTMGLAQTPRAVGWPTLRALARRSTVRPGWLSKLLEWSLALMPRRGRVWAMQRVMRGMARR